MYEVSTDAAEESCNKLLTLLPVSLAYPLIYDTCYSVFTPKSVQVICVT